MFMRKIKVIKIIHLKLLLLIYFLKTFGVDAQLTRMRPQVNEFTFGMGLTNALTDVGGLNLNALTAVPVDLNLVATNKMIALGYKRRLIKQLTYKSFIQWGTYTGNDKYTTNIQRNYRSLHFKTEVIEFSNLMELTYFEYGRFIWVQRRRRKRIPVSYNISSGITVFYFEPMGMLDGKWYNLRPLSTEGQGLVKGTKPYSKFAISIPVGIGGKLKLRNISVGLDLVYNKTFTDYFDDVSGFYFDKEVILNEKGGIASHFADPSNGEKPHWTSPGAIRGNPKQKDAYVQLIFSINYYLNRRF